MAAFLREAVAAGSGGRWVSLAALASMDAAAGGDDGDGGGGQAFVSASRGGQHRGGARHRRRSGGNGGGGNGDEGEESDEDAGEGEAEAQAADDEVAAAGSALPPVYVSLASFGGAGRERGPLLPHACAMALLPASAAHLALPALRHLMATDSPIQDIYAECRRVWGGVGCRGRSR